MPPLGLSFTYYFPPLKTFTQFVLLNSDGILLPAVESRFPSHTPAQHALIVDCLKNVIQQISSSPSWTATTVSTLLSIAIRVIFQLFHEYSAAMSSSQGDQHFRRAHDVMQRLLLRHAVQRPPYSIALFALPVLQAANNVLLDVVFRDMTLLAAALARQQPRAACDYADRAVVKQHRLVCPCCRQRRMRVLASEHHTVSNAIPALSNQAAPAEPVSEAPAPVETSPEQPAEQSAEQPAEQTEQSVEKPAEPVNVPQESFEQYCDEDGSAHDHRMDMPAITVECPECLILLTGSLRVYEPCAQCNWWPADDDVIAEERQRQTDRRLAALKAREEQARIAAEAVAAAEAAAAAQAAEGAADAPAS
jgi:hypothetical protein